MAGPGRQAPVGIGGHPPAAAVGVPDAIIAKAPSADLWPGQTDEAEAAFTYPELDRLLLLMVDRRRSDED